MTQRAKHSQVIAAARSGISLRTASRIDNQIHQPKQANRHWRTGEDPPSVIWVPIVLPLLQQSDSLHPLGYSISCVNSTAISLILKHAEPWNDASTAGVNYMAVLKK